MSVFAIGHTREVGTLADGLAEPSDLLVDGPELVVVESAAHRLVRLPLPARTRDLGGPLRLAAEVAPGPVTVRVRVHAAAGTASRPPVRRAHVVDGHRCGSLRVSAAAAACDGHGVFAACHLYRQEWLLDVRPVAGGATEIVLDLPA